MTVENDATQTQSPTISKLADALCKAQKVMSAAKKESENPFFHSTYADLASVWDAIRTPLTDNGLAIVQTLGGSWDAVTVITTLMHVSGEWIRGTITMKPAKSDPQTICACITYCRRASLTCITGCVAAELDDDGNMASGRQTSATQEQKAVSKPAIPTPAAPAKQPATKSALKPLKTWEQVTNEIHTELGDEAYFKILGEHGVTKAIEITNKAEQADCWLELKAKLKEMQGV